jgi:hypothetical protein
MQSAVKCSLAIKKLLNKTVCVKRKKQQKLKKKKLMLK